MHFEKEDEGVITHRIAISSKYQGFERKNVNLIPKERVIFSTIPQNSLQLKTNADERKVNARF